MVRDDCRSLRQLSGQMRGTAVPRSDGAGPSTQPGVRRGPTTKFTAPAYYKFESIFLQRRVSCELGADLRALTSMLRGDIFCRRPNYGRSRNRCSKVVWVRDMEGTVSSFDTIQLFRFRFRHLSSEKMRRSDCRLPGRRHPVPEVRSMAADTASSNWTRSYRIWAIRPAARRRNRLRGICSGSPV